MAGKFPNSPANLPAVIPSARTTPVAALTPEQAWEKSCFTFTIGKEGGLSTDRHDPGNWTGGKVGKGTFVGTKYGISAAAHPGLDIPKLTLAEARTIYWQQYVVEPHFDKLPLALLLVVFEASVNDGQAAAKSLLPQATKYASLPDQIKAFCAANLAYHKRLSNWSRYGKQWAARIADGQKQALLLAAASPVPLTPPVASSAHQPVRTVPKPSTQPEASGWTLFWRAIFSGLFSPLPKGT